MKGMLAATKTLSHTCIEEAVNLLFSILDQMGEPSLRQVGDAQLAAEMQSMIGILHQTTNDAILSMGEVKERKIATLMKVYVHLLAMLHFCKQTLFAAASLRLIEMTLKHGLSQASPMAIVHYAEILSRTSYVDLALRLGKYPKFLDFPIVPVHSQSISALLCMAAGKVALELMEKKAVTSRYKGAVLSVYHYIFWRSTPFQSMIDFHELGCKAGMQSGDSASFILNHSLGISAKFASGQCLNDARRQSRELILQTHRQNFHLSTDHVALAHVNFCALIKGKHMLDAEQIDDVLGKAEIIAKARKNGDSSILFTNLVCQISRTVLFREYDTVSESSCISDMMFENIVPLRLALIFSLFLEGLASFQLVRQTTGAEPLKWTKKGLFILKKMQAWSERCPWNFQNKCLLLEAEFMSVSGNFQNAESLYLSSIRSAIEHKFKHEEAIASELTGLFFHGIGLHQNAHTFFIHSEKCFRQWGAKAVALRVEKSIQAMYGPDYTPLRTGEDSLAYILSHAGTSSKKRQEIG